MLDGTGIIWQSQLTCANKKRSMKISVDLYHEVALADFNLMLFWQ